ncbi:MAG: response regulator transcription factor, partial [Terriglobales bacterium]
MEPSVAIAEDDRTLRALLSRGLREEGFIVNCAVGSGGELLDRVMTARPDVIVMDIGLPDADGRDVVAALRARDVWTPALILTARGNLTDRLSGFHSGADDYLPKPFSFAELIVRLRSLARRATPASADMAESVGLRLDPTGH